MLHITIIIIIIIIIIITIVFYDKIFTFMKIIYIHLFI